MGMGWDATSILRWQILRLGPDLGLWQAKMHTKPHPAGRVTSNHSVIQAPLAASLPISASATFFPQNWLQWHQNHCDARIQPSPPPPYHPTCTTRKYRQRLSEVCIPSITTQSTICQLCSVYPFNSHFQRSTFDPATAPFTFLHKAKNPKAPDRPPLKDSSKASLPPTDASRKTTLATIFISSSLSLYFLFDTQHPACLFPAARYLLRSTWLPLQSHPLGTSDTTPGSLPKR